MKSKFLNYLSKEIAIEYKSCLYFFCFLTFYCGYLLWQKTDSVSILFLLELICTTYFMGYFQVYVLHNFDEADRLGKREILSIVFCTGIYTAVSYFFNWFARNLLVSLLFYGFVFLSYLCAFLVNKLKRDVDTENLNQMLMQYKNGK